MAKKKKKASKVADLVFSKVRAELGVPLTEEQTNNVSTGEYAAHRAYSMLDIPVDKELIAYNPQAWAYFEASLEMRRAAKSNKLDHYPMYYGDYLVPNGILLATDKEQGALHVKVWSVEHDCYMQLTVDKHNFDVLVHQDKQAPGNIDYAHLGNAVLAVGERFPGLA